MAQASFEDNVRSLVGPIFARGFVLKTFSLNAMVFLLWIGAVAADWEHFQGPNADGISNEKGLKSKALKKLWQSNIKTGFSSMSVSNGVVYSMGNDGTRDIVYALNAKNGEIIWEYSYKCELDPNLYEGGPNATPTVHEGKVYTLSKEGHVFCFDGKSGKVLWQLHCGDFGAIKPKWGFAGSPTILGQKVLLNVGDSGAAIDKNSGKVLWSSKGDNAGYASVVPFKKDEVIVLCGDAFKSVEVSTGKVLWSEPFPAAYKVNAAAPIIVEDKILLSTGYGEGRSGFYQIEGSKPKQIWESTELKAHFSNPIYLKGYFYAITGNTGKSCKIKCMAAKTGAVMWEERCKFGSLRATEDKLYFLNEKGLLTVLEATPKAYQEVSSSEILANKSWTPPTISHGVLYARDAKGDLVAIDLTF